MTDLELHARYVPGTGADAVFATERAAVRQAMSALRNAAGNFYAPSATLSPNAWKSVVEIDLYGTFYCSQAVYPIMAAQGGGRHAQRCHPDHLWRSAASLSRGQE